VRENLPGILVGLLLAGIVQSCSISPAQQEAIRQAWEERDAERARECQRAGRSCGGGGGP
jgi:hypothetical protein